MEPAKRIIYFVAIRIHRRRDDHQLYVVFGVGDVWFELDLQPFGAVVYLDDQRRLGGGPAGICAADRDVVFTRSKPGKLGLDLSQRVGFPRPQFAVQAADFPEYGRMLVAAAIICAAVGTFADTSGPFAQVEGGRDCMLRIVSEARLLLARNYGDAWKAMAECATPGGLTRKAFAQVFGYAYENRLTLKEKEERQ